MMKREEKRKGERSIAEEESLLFLNTLALLIADSAQTLMEVWIVYNEEYPTKNNDFFASLFIVHSFSFYTCTLTFILMIFERFLLCFNPFFYEDKDWDFPRFLFVISIVSFPFIVCIVMILQDDIMKMVSAFTMALVEGTSAWMLILCHRKSQEYYTTRFMVVPLNVRYQVNDFSPFPTPSLFFQASKICSSYSLMEPIILINRVKIIHRRFKLILKRSKVNSVDYIPSDYNPQSYFIALRDQWG
ncbi:hypothetical protein PRIPAC_79041 [Pristionchus pacificus]|uniref:Uncharacterized protein n=1 Tax=Pristionchus pacificus TaxID=54126 RepID=A0A2A6CBF0_PRIPA|nr:hypothetical protein PRIPAC_79041 [Pristionchus pacificus]|eukprot:PDM75494.1 hypothetical protein PRIPAC_42671 [Pristionchus pacificus]